MEGRWPARTSASTSVWQECGCVPPAVLSSCPRPSCARSQEPRQVLDGCLELAESSLSPGRSQSGPEQEPCSPPHSASTWGSLERPGGLPGGGATAPWEPLPESSQCPAVVSSTQDSPPPPSFPCPSSSGRPLTSLRVKTKAASPSGLAGPEPESPRWCPEGFVSRRLYPPPPPFLGGLGSSWTPGCRSDRHLTLLPGVTVPCN